MRSFKRAGALLVALAIGAISTGVAGGGGSRPDAALADPLFTIGMAHAHYTPQLDGSKPIFILVLGDNYRAGIVDNHLTDSVHLIGVNLATKQATILGIPRDSWVEIPGHGKGKINEA